MSEARAASQRVRMCTVDRVSGNDSPSSSTRASSSPSRCSALSLRSAISGTPWPVSAMTRGHGGGAQRGHGVGVDRPLDGEVVQQLLGVARGQVVAASRRLAVDPRGLAEELGEGVQGVRADPHRVRVRGRVRAPEGVAGAGLALGRVGEPRRGPFAVYQVPRGQLLLRPGGLLGVAKVLVEEGLAYPAGARRQVAPGEMPEELVDCVARRRAGVQGWHAQHNSRSKR